MSRRNLCCLFAACCLGAAADAQSALRLSGSWEGEVRPDSRLPFLPWRLRVDASTAGTADATLVLRTPGGELTAHVTRYAKDSAFAWRVAPQLLQAVALRDWLAPLLPGAADLALEGEIEVRGDGAWNGAGAEGLLLIDWQSDGLAWPQHDLRLDRPHVTARIEVAGSAIKAITFAADWADAQAAEIVLGAGTVRATSGAGETWRLETLALDVWRGHIRIAPFTFDPAKPQVDTTVTVENVALADLADFFPQAVRAAEGRLSGAFDIRWNPIEGLTPGRGTLQVLNTEIARVQLAPSPGLLSERMPESIAVLPRWTGPLARWSAVDNPARDELKRVELGERFITVDTLEVQLHPDGVGREVSARVRLVGRPEASKLVEMVDFTVNVSGPLQDLIELGLDQRARISTGP